MSTKMDSEPRALPADMRAWVHRRAGAPKDILTLETVPCPKITSSTEVLIRVHYASLNPGGSIMMQLCPSMFRAKPCIPELDVAGELVQVSEGVPLSRSLKPGMKVFGSIPVPAHITQGHGALAEYAVIDASYVVEVPQTIDLKQSAGLSVAGCTALALFSKAALKPGQRVLVNAAGGGIGSLALQMVREAIGDEGVLVAVCSADKAELAKNLRANEVVDYRAKAPVHQFLTEKYGDAKFDRVIDAIGVHELFANSAGFLKEDGLFVTVGIAFEKYTYGSVFWAVGCMLTNILWPRALWGTPRQYVQVSSMCDLESLQELAKQCEAGKLKVPIDSCWDLEDVQGAYERALSKRAKGKIVVRIHDEGK